MEEAMGSLRDMTTNYLYGCFFWKKIINIIAINFKLYIIMKFLEYKDINKELAKLKEVNDSYYGKSIIWNIKENRR